MNIFTKLLRIPSGTKNIEAVQMWEVRWTSLHGRYSCLDQKPELEAFCSEELANEFAQALRDAFKLVGTTAHTRVIVSKKKAV